MRKIIIIIALFVLSIGVHSCSLDKTLKTSLPRVETPSDVASIRIGMYSLARGVYMGDGFIPYDVMSDMFNQTILSGNRQGPIYNWRIESDHTENGDMWYTAYTLISRANLIIDKADDIAAANPSDATRMMVYKGEALLWRAMIHRFLAHRYSVAYDPATAASKLGVPYMDEYGPNYRKDRGTVQYTYDKILEDVLAAEPLLTTQGVNNSIFFTSDCVTAFKVQLYVDMQKYAEAIVEADKIIGKYPLVSRLDDLELALKKDKSTETIFQLSFNREELSMPLSYYDYYQGAFNEKLDKDVIIKIGYVPSQMTIDLYDAADFRSTVYLQETLITIVGSDRTGIVARKFRGNEDFRAQGTVHPDYNAFSSAKLFRIADIIMLKAEAQYRTGAEGAASTTLNTLRVARGLTDTNFSGDALFKEIQDERTREMFGEGSRIADIKRWKITATRVPQTLLVRYLQSASNHNLVIKHDADKILWPIPLREFSTNKELVGQQNPGYSE